MHDAEMMQALADKSGADRQLTADIFARISAIEAGQAVDAAELITFNHNIEQFYYQSR